MTDNKTVTCLFLGSGASRALAGIPIQRDFLCSLLTEERSKWVDECDDPRMTIGGAKLSEWMLEVGDIELCMSYLHNMAYSEPLPKKPLPQGDRNYCVRAIINLRAAIADYLRKFKPKPDIGRKFKEWLSRLKKGDSSPVFITTNYDLILENMLGVNQYYYPIKNEDNGKTRIYKLHGSINWLEKRWLTETGELKKRKERVANVADISDELVYEPPEKSKWPCLIRWKKYKEKGAWGKSLNTYNPILIPFFYQKDEWLGDSGGWKEIFPNHWKSAEEFLGKGLTDFYFLGYSLPPADYHMLSWLLNILKKNKPGITIVCNGQNEPLERVLKPFKPRVCRCGLEKFLEDHV